MSQNDPFGPEKFEVYQEPESAGTPPERKGPGCLFWGCLITGILSLVLVVLVVALVFFLRGKIVDTLREYTDPQPVELPEVQIDEERRAEIIDRWDSFQTALDQGNAAEIALDSDEFNVIVRQEFPEASDRIYFTIDGDHLRGQISVPVEEFGRKVLRTGQLDGRYFNASGTFDVFFRNGVLVLQLQEAEVKGEPVPDEAMQQIRTQNLAENLANSPENRELLSRFERIEVKDGRIILASQGADASSQDDSDPADEPDGASAEEETPQNPDSDDLPSDLPDSRPEIEDDDAAEESVEGEAPAEESDQLEAAPSP